MNQHLHGKGLKVAAAGRILPILLLLLSSSVTASVDDSNRLSGVVKPKVSVIKPYAASEAPVIEEFRVPTLNSVPTGLAIDSKDRIWFTEMLGNSLAVFDPSTGQLKEYRVPSTKDLPETEWKYDPKKREMPEKTINIYSVGNPGNIIVTKEGIVWFVMQLGNSVVRFDPIKEEFTEFIVPTQNALPYDLVEDSKGNIWFIEKNVAKLAYLDMEKRKVVEIKLEKGANLMGITVDNEDNIWLADAMGNYIGRYNPQTRKIKRYPITTPNAQPGILRFDNAGRLWICQGRTKQIGVLIPDLGVFSVADMPGYNAVPQSLVPSDDDKIWFVDIMMNRVGFFDTINLKWSIFPIPTINAQPMDIGIDSKGDIWFTQSGLKANKIARLIRSTVPAELSGGGAARDGIQDRNLTKQDSLTEKSFAGLQRLAIIFVVGGIVLLTVVLGFVFIRRKRSKA